jgi:hypothetical protein
MIVSTLRISLPMLAAVAWLAGCQSVPLELAEADAATPPPAALAPAAAPATTATPVSAAPRSTAATRPAEASPPTSLLSPMLERREAFVATGYATISVQNHKTPAQQRLLAIRASKLDAYRSLAEQVYGQQLDATTTVSQMTVMSDTFRARVEGVIYGAVLVSITPVGDDTYETTLSLDRGVVEDLRSLYIAQLAARTAPRRVP